MSGTFLSELCLCVTTKMCHMLSIYLSGLAMSAVNSTHMCDMLDRALMYCRLPIIYQISLMRDQMEDWHLIGIQNVINRAALQLGLRMVPP